MEIEDIKLLFNDLENQERLLSWEYNDLSTYVNQQQSDLLEAYKAIVKSVVHYDTYDMTYNCNCCKEWDFSPDVIHKKDCIVLKADKYLKEHE